MAEKLYTVVTPLKQGNGRYQRRIMTLPQLRSFLDIWQANEQQDRFYVEPHVPGQQDGAAQWF